jgi:hypothetical protein
MPHSATTARARTIVLASVLFLAACAGPGSVVAPTAPAPPSNVAATPGERSVTVTFDLVDGGSPITLLEYRLEEDWVAAPAASSPIVVADLEPGVTATITLRASNAIGTSDPSQSVASIPWFPPYAALASGTLYTTGYGIAALSDGSALVTGAFTGDATFGATVTLTSAGQTDIYVAKVDAAGAFVWSARAGGSAYEAGLRIVPLGDDGALVVGTFRGTATFGTAPAIASAGEEDVFVARISPEGAWLWARRGGGGQADAVRGIAILDGETAVVTGYFSGTADFGSTAALTSAGQTDLFVAAISTDGEWLWSRRAGGGGSDRGNGVAARAGGELLVTGWFSGTGTFGEEPFENVGSSGIVAAIDAAGTLLWAAGTGGTGSPTGNAVTALGDGSAIVAGTVFGGTVTFGDTALTAPDASQEVFVARIGTDGAWQWARHVGGTSLEVSAITALPDGSAVVTGYFEEVATFGTALSVESAGGSDLFIARISADGDWLWARRAGGPGYADGNDVAALRDGSVLHTGSVEGTATFGARELEAEPTSSNAYVARIRPDGVW